MNTHTIVALNILYDGKVYNTVEFNAPYILYLNDEDCDITLFLKNDISFKNVINSLCTENVEIYNIGEISFSYYNDESESFFSDSITINSLFSMKEIIPDIWKYYTYEILKDLYYKAYKEDYVDNDNWLIDCFEKISVKAKNPITQMTIINYIRKTLLSEYKLSTENTNYIIENINNSLNENQ